MAIVRWDPFREFAQMQDRLNRVFVDAYGRPATDEGLMTTGAWMPPVDIYQNGDHELVLKAELPDMTRQDINITVDKGTLTIAGEKKMEKEEKGAKYHRIETSFGSFMRTFTLPEDADTNKILAEYKDGTLMLKVARTAGAHKTAGRTIAVK